MEITIAIGLGCWFVLIGALSTIMVFKDFDKATREEDHKK